jgi:toxin ParE1/3/4
MIPGPVVLRERALRDIDEAVDWYRVHAGTAVAMRFVDALERAVASIATHPRAGSPRYAHELDLPGLRTVTVADFPHLVFYVDAPTHVDVWRVLHGERDLPSTLLEES